jgi:methylmalonyl-CoA/ethylmalonyl-CoA epimerase
MVIDHIGIVVRSLEEGMRQWENLFGYKKCSDIVPNARQKVRIVFMSKPHSLTVKLIEALSPDSPVSGFAKRGGGLHHLCFRCQNVDSEIAGLTGKGAFLTVRPEPGEAFNGNPIAFLMAKNNLNLELIDTQEKAGWREVE